MIQKKWFSIEHLKDGSLGKVIEVEAKGRNGSVVRFYEATGKADACSQAKQWWEKRKAGRKPSDEARVARLKAAHLCLRCMRPAGVGRDPYYGRQAPATYCAECAERKIRDKGKSSRPRYETPEERKESIARSIRLRISLVTVLKKFRELGPIEFEAWVLLEMDERRRPVARGPGRPRARVEPVAHVSQ